MSSKSHRGQSLRDIFGEDNRVAQPKQSVVEVAPAPSSEPIASSLPAQRRQGTLKQRAHQLSTYLEEPVYDTLRDIAHAERVKMHSLLLEGVDLVLKKRGLPSIAQLMSRHGRT
jgi:hypothetical protein